MTIAPLPRTSVPATTPTRALHAPGQPSGGPPSIDLMRILRKYKWSLVAAAIIGGILGVGAHILLKRFYPIYTVTMIYEASQREDKLDTSLATPQNDKEMERFMTTQVLALKSTRILEDTARDPLLRVEAPKWYEKFIRKGLYDNNKSAEYLSSNLSAGIMADSNFIEVRFWWTNPEDATGIMRIHQKNYEAYRQQSVNIATSENKKAIQESITNAVNKIKNLQTERGSIVQDGNVEGIEEQHSTTTAKIAAMQNEIVLSDRTIEQASSMLREMEAQLNSPNPLVIDDKIRAEIEFENSIQWLKSTVNSLETEYKAMLDRGFARNHRSVIQLETRLDSARARLEEERQRKGLERFNAQMNNLRVTIDSERANVLALTKKIELDKVKAAELTKLRERIKDLVREIDQLTQEKTKFEVRLSEINAMEQESRHRRINVYSAPQTPHNVSFPKLYFMIPAGLILTVGLVGALIMLRELMDQRVKGAADISMIGRTRVLGIIPDITEDRNAPPKLETVFRDQPHSILSESFRQARAAIVKQMHQHGRKTLLVASGMPGPDGTAVACNLAFAFASSQMRVLLIDANLRRPAIARSLGLSDGPGLSELLAGETTLAEAAQETDTHGLSILTAGSSSNRIVERLTSEAMNQLLAEASQAYDIVVLDTAPAVVAHDAVALSHRCDATVLVVKAMNEKRGLVARLRNELSETKAEFLGVIVTGVRSAVGGYLSQNIAVHRDYHNGEHKS